MECQYMWKTISQSLILSLNNSMLCYRYDQAIKGQWAKNFQPRWVIFMEQFPWEMGRQKQNFLLRNYLSANTAAAAKSLQSCPTPCDPIDSSLPGSPLPGIL